MKIRFLILILLFVLSIGFTGTAFASEYTGETPLYLFDYLKDKPIAYIIDYKIDGYLRNAVVNFGSNTIIFEIKDNGILTVEIPKTHFLPSDYFPTLLIDKVNSDPREFLIKDEECFREYKFSVNQSTMIKLIMEGSSDASSIINENILVNCQNKIDNEITDIFDFNTIFEDELEYAIIDGKQYLSKTIKSSLSNLTHDETIFELSEMKFHLYDKREDRTVYPGMGIMGMRTPVLFEFPDGAIKEISIKTTRTPHDVMDDKYATIEMYTRPNWPEVGVVAGLTPSNQITKLLVFEKNISPHMQLQHDIEPENISCKVGLELIEKYGGSSACVTSKTKTKLIERGWITCDNGIRYDRGHPCGPRSSPGIVTIGSGNHKEISIIVIPLGAVIDGNEYLIPDEITVVLGKNNTVTWVNEDDTAHGFASDKGGDGSWGTGIILPSKESSIIFNQTGIFEYYGEPHLWMTGKIIVLEE